MLGIVKERGLIEYDFFGQFDGIPMCRTCRLRTQAHSFWLGRPIHVATSMPPGLKPNAEAQIVRKNTYPKDSNSMF